MEKECEICGTVFETKNKLRKYCDNCQKHTGRNRREVERGIRHIAELTREPNVHEVECEECGKVFKTIASCHIIFDDNEGRHLFCSPRCKDSYIKYHGVCDRCGKQFAGDYYPVLGGKNYGYYCSAECYQDFRQEQKEAAYVLCTCAHCGKEFRKPQKQTFCSVECYRAAVAAGWRSTQAEEKNREMEIVVRGKCKNCGKRTETRTRAEFVENMTLFCSEKCSKEYWGRIRAESKRKAKENKEKQEKESLEKTGFALCATCKVRYNDCSYMRTNYVNLPPGAHMNSDGKIVECPQYRGPLRKKEGKENG